MKDHNERYLRRLGFWLRAGGVGGAQALSILSDVRSHVADSGENPNEAFGSPRTYAKKFSEGSTWTWARRATGVLALVALSAGSYLAADDVAHVRTQRPLWFSAPQWVVVTGATMVLLVGWWALLAFTSAPLSSLARQDVDAEQSWKIRVHRRRLVSLALLVVVVGSTSIWATALGHAYLETPKLRATNFVYSNDSGAVANSTDTPVAVRTVIYLDAPGPPTSLNMATLSSRSDPSGDVTSSLQGFGSLTQALGVAMGRNFSLNSDELPGYSLHYGTYYVLTWIGQIYSTYSSTPSTQESLVVTYLVSGVGLKTLRIPLSINS